MDKYQKKIEEFRSKIDAIDKKMIELLNRRAGYAVKIGHLKRILKMPVYVPSREEQVINNVQKQNPGPLGPEAVRRLYERIIDESRRLEREHFAADNNDTEKYR